MFAKLAITPPVSMQNWGHKSTYLTFSMINNLIVCLSDNFTFKTLSEKHWTVGKGSDRQDAKLAYTLISEQTAALLKTYFETDTRMMALYQFISIFSTVRKIMTSRKIWNK